MRATIIGVGENSCANDVMMNGRGSSPSERTFVVRVMPTTWYTLESVLKVWPIALLAWPELPRHRFVDDGDLAARSDCRRQ